MRLCASLSERSDFFFFFFCFSHFKRSVNEAFIFLAGLPHSFVSPISFFGVVVLVVIKVWSDFAPT